MANSCPLKTAEFTFSLSSFGMPISVYAPRSSGAQAYRELALELLKGDGVKIDPGQE